MKCPVCNQPIRVGEYVVPRYLMARIVSTGELKPSQILGETYQHADCYDPKSERHN